MFSSFLSSSRVPIFIFTFPLKVLPVPWLGYVCSPQAPRFPLFKDVLILLHSWLRFVLFSPQYCYIYGLLNSFLVCFCLPTHSLFQTNVQKQYCCCEVRTCLLLSFFFEVLLLITILLLYDICLVFGEKGSLCYLSYLMKSLIRLLVVLTWRVLRLWLWLSSYYYSSRSLIFSFVSLPFGFPFLPKSVSNLPNWKFSSTFSFCA